MTFPNRSFDKISLYAEAYFERLLAAGKSIDGPSLDAAGNMLRNAYDQNATVYVCGNGGSASISNHLVCDHMKGVQTDTKIRPRVISLSSNIELITAIANDISYDDVFVYQLSTMAQSGDVLLTISSSGNSENIVRAVKWANINKQIVNFPDRGLSKCPQSTQFREMRPAMHCLVWQNCSRRQASGTSLT